jgi:hypothetical protein
LGRVGGTDDETGIRERCKFREDITWRPREYFMETSVVTKELW